MAVSSVSSIWSRALRSVWSRRSSSTLQWSRDCVALLTEIAPLSSVARRERILQLAGQRAATSVQGDTNNSATRVASSAGDQTAISAATDISSKTSVQKEDQTSPEAVEPQQLPPTHNKAAVTLLRWEKEVSLLRYYGIWGYIREKRPFSLSLPSLWSNKLPSLTTWRSNSSSTIEVTSRSETDASAVSSADREVSMSSTLSSTSSAATPNVAKIAFMITASMWAELHDQLQYSHAEIKSLTPLQASLILQHSIRPDQRHEQLPLLIEKHNQDMQQLQQQQRQREEELLESRTHQVSADSPTAGTDKSAIDQPAATHVDASSHGSSFNTLLGTKWYQIVERNRADITTDNTDETSDNKSSDNTDTVVAMYLHEHEAEFGRETHQHLADRRAQRAAAVAATTKGSSSTTAHNTRSDSTTAPVYEIRTVYIK